jgi:cytochrome P450
MSNLQLAFAGVLIALIVHRVWIKPLFSPLRHLPAPDQGPARKRLFVEPNPDQLTEWAHNIPNKGFIKYHGVLNIQKVLVTDPNAFHDILTTNPYSYVKPPPIRKIIRSLVGDGLITAEGEAHKTQKKAMQLAFKARQVKDLYPVFERKAKELVDKLSEVAKMGNSSTSVDLGSYLHHTTLDIIGIAGFGLDFKCLKEPNNKLATDYARGFTPSKSAQKYRMLALFMPPWLLDRLPLKRNQDLRAAVAAVWESASRVIKQKGAGLDGQAKQAEHLAYNDIIGVLMKEGNVRDEQTLVNQAMTVVAAGHDTLHFVIESAIWEMSRHPAVQDRLRQELRQSLNSSAGDSDGQMHHADIDNLPYLQAVCNEVLRLHHSIPALHRRSIEDVVIAGQAFPKGTSFIMPIHALNCSPKLWNSDPLAFDPERWMHDPSLGGAEDRKGNMTFSAGARVCIGERFARAELKHLLAGLVSNYKFTWAGTGDDGKQQKLQLEHGITSRMIGSLWVNMEPVSG